MDADNAVENRALILAPRGRDAPTIADTLGRGGIVCAICPNLDGLRQELERGAGVALMTEEALLGADLEPLLDWLGLQPAWSDFALIILTDPRRSPRAVAADVLIQAAHNVILLQRPLSVEALCRAVSSALRARHRQYQTRKLLAERQEASDRLQASEDALRSLNETLESRILERTRELALANDRLMREITERERTQMALTQAQKMEAIGRLTGGLAHDFNNLLHVIVGNMDLIDLLSNDERLKHFAAIAKKAAHRGSKLTGQLLAFARKQNLDLKAVDIPELVEGMKDLLHASVGGMIPLHFDFEPGLPSAIADANQLEMAILNLAINARDAMPQGGRLTLSYRVREAKDGTVAAGRYGVIAVRDTGTGISPDILAKVFDPFFTTKPVGQGTGLGLSQVYGIARQSGGVAHIVSEVGVGTTVEIWLPLAPVEHVGDRPVRASLTHKAAHALHKILVIEDDEEVRAFMVESLCLLGYEVFHAQDGPAGLALLDEKRPDLMIVDFLMPKMDGAEVVAAASSRRPDLPIIMATGYADMQAIEKVIGANAILRKPFQIADLAGSVQKALQRCLS